MLDFEKMSPKQKETLEKLWGICAYLQAARRYAPESVLAAQAAHIGSFMDDLDKQESKKTSGESPKQVG